MTAANGLIHHNVLFCHLFDAVTKSQGMAALIIGAKTNTVCGILNSTFPAIQTTQNSPTPYVTPATVAYIHALIIDSLSLRIRLRVPLSVPFNAKLWLAKNWKPWTLPCSTPNCESP